GDPARGPRHRPTGDRLPSRRRPARARRPGRVARAATGVATRVGPSGTFAAFLVLGLLVITAASSLFAGLYVAGIDDDGVALLDEPALHLATDVRSPWLDTAVTVFTEAAGVYAVPIVSVAGIVAYLLVLRQMRRATRVLTYVIAMAFAASVSLSRVYLGHHWLTDVIAGWLLALAWLAVVVVAHRVRLRLMEPRERDADGT
ncbi:phosphatase PAP2 family protein, partial [Clavibacter michiganensis]